MKIGALKKDPVTQIVYRYTGEIDGLDEFIVNGTGTPYSDWFTDGKKIGERKMYTPTGHVYFWNGTTWVLEWFPWQPVIANGSIGTAKLTDGAITTDKIADEAVDGSKIADDSVDTTHLVNEAVTEDKLSDDSVSTDKIVDGAVTEDKLANDSVSTDKIVDGAVTAGKLA